MTRVADIQARVAGMSELGDIVGAMRSVAVMRMQQAQRALDGVRRYAEAIAGGLRMALPLLPQGDSAAPPRAPAGILILYMAEHGFVGGFNERLLDAAAAQRPARDGLFIVGSRGAALAAERGWKPAWTRAMATRLEGIDAVVQALADELFRRLLGGGVHEAAVLFARCEHGGREVCVGRRLFPLDRAGLAAGREGLPPLHNLAPSGLVEALAAQHMLARLIEAATESLASENAARFNAMEAARDNVSHKLERLRQQAREARQNEITIELMDLVTGAAAAPAVHQP